MQPVMQIFKLSLKLKGAALPQVFSYRILIKIGYRSIGIWTLPYLLGRVIPIIPSNVRLWTTLVACM